MKTIRNFMIFSAVCLCLALSARFLNQNTVFAPENFKKDKESAQRRQSNNSTISENTSKPSIPMIETKSEEKAHNTTTKNDTPSVNPSPAKNDTPSVNPSPAKNDTPSVNPTPAKNDTPSVNPTPSNNESYNINYDCPEGMRFNNTSGRCVNSNTTEIMYTNRTTSTKINIHPDNMITPTIVDKLNITQHYVDRKAAQNKKK
jgi:hypothetical protein